MVDTSMETTAAFLSDRIGVTLGESALLVAVPAAGFIAALVISFVGRRLEARGRLALLAAVIRRTRRALKFLLPVVALALALPGLGSADGFIAYLVRALALLAIVLGGWCVVGVVRGFVDHVIATHSLDVADNLEARRVQTQIRVLGRAAVFVVIVATLAGVLMSIPSIRTVGVSLFASAGIAGLAIGLAARPALANLIAGIQIALTQPIRIDDAVLVEGEWGWIEEITMTFVVVRIWDLRRLVLPISWFIENPFENWTRTTADILGSVILHMDYRVPLDAVREEFARALRDSPHWDRKVEAVHVVDCTDRTMQIRLLMSAANSPAAWELRCAVRERLIGYLQEHYPDSLPRLRLEGGPGRLPEAGGDGAEGD